MGPAIWEAGMGGELDTTFGPQGSGKIETTIPAPHSASIGAVAVLADGNLIAAGTSFNGATNDFALARYSPGGVLDTTFGIEGRMVHSVGPLNDSAAAVIVQPDEKIVAAGRSQPGPSFGASDFALARYLPDGMLDPAFGSRGSVTTPIGTGADLAFALALQADGKLVAIGVAAQTGAAPEVALARYNQNGSLDATFGAGGKVKGPSGSAAAGAVQRDGKILAAGATPGTPTDFCLVCFNANGSLDTGFGAGGIVRTPIGAGNDSISPVAIQPDGKILVAGRTSTGTTDAFGLVRYNPNGTLDATFGNAGKVVTDIGRHHDRANDLTLQRDGKILVVGNSFQNTSVAMFAVVRYNTNGSLDASFGTGGKVTTQFSVDDFAGAVAIQPDGNIVVAGSASNGVDRNFALARFRA